MKKLIVGLGILLTTLNVNAVETEATHKARYQACVVTAAKNVKHYLGIDVKQHRLLSENSVYVFVEVAEPSASFTKIFRCAVHEESNRLFLTGHSDKLERLQRFADTGKLY